MVKKDGSQFKTFFRLTVGQNPIPLHSRLREIYRVNPVMKSIRHFTKVGFAFGFLLWVKDGSSIPG
jgi:hypothetical protein